MQSALKIEKIVKFVKIMAQTFLNCESTCDLPDVQASLYDRKTAARSFGPIHDILRSPSLEQSLLKGRCVNIAGANVYETVGNRRVKML